VFLLKEIRFWADTLYAMRAMRQAERGQYRDTQSKRLKALVKHAFENVDVYRRKYDQAGVRPEDIQTIDDLHKLPIITRQDLIDGFPDAILARNCSRQDCQLAATSGSTGTPLKVYKDRSLLRRSALAIALANRMLKSQVGVEARAGVLAIEVDSPDSIEAIMQEEVAKLPRFLSRSFRAVDARKDPHEHIRIMAECQPDIVFAYPSVLRNIAVTAHEERLQLHQPKVLALSSELLDENTRRTVSSVFKGEMINMYMGTEGGMMAMECRQRQGMHVACSGIVLEVVKDGKPVPPGVPGSVVLTNLANRSTPIIRYSGMGDVAVFKGEACPCGSKLPLLKVIEGRIVDSVVLRDGRLVHPFTLTLALEHVPKIASFQIVQESFDHVRTLIVPERGTDGHSAICEETRRNLRQILGEDVDIRVEVVQDIPDLRQPGFHTVKSLVAKQGWE
jgi:phenylacetate-CoA ligase